MKLCKLIVFIISSYYTQVTSNVWKMHYNLTLFFGNLKQICGKNNGKHMIGRFIDSQFNKNSLD